MATQDVTEAKGTKSKAFTQSRLGRAFSPSYRFDHRFDDIHLRPEAGTRFEGRTPTANIISRDQAKKGGHRRRAFQSPVQYCQCGARVGFPRGNRQSDSGLRLFERLAFVLFVFFVGTAQALAGSDSVSFLPANIVVEDVAVSAWDDEETASAQILLRNTGDESACTVQVTEITVSNGSYAGPATLPISLGILEAGKDARFDSLLKMPVDGSENELVVKGEYGCGSFPETFVESRTIAPNVAPPGPFESRSGQATVQKPSEAVYPPAPPPATFGPNAESPIFVPLGPPRLLPAPINPNNIVATDLGTSQGGAAVRIPRNTSMRSAGVPPDPNVAADAPNGVVLATYNTGISYSTDGGAKLTDVNLFSPQPGNPARTSFFPQDDGGLCCDQVVVYLRNQNLFVWLLQYQPVVNTAVTPNVITSPNRLRIAWATPAAIRNDFWNAWTYVDLTGTNVAGVSDGLGINNNEWLDYPDLAWSDTFLYVGVDHGFSTPGQVYTGRRIVPRLSLADMANPAATAVNYRFAELTGSNGLNKTHFVQNAPGRMVVGSLDNSSTLRVFTWMDGEDSIPSPSTVGISQIQQGASYTSTAPDGSDWVAVSFPGNISGATYRSVIPGLGVSSRPEYVFAFTAGTNAGGGRPQAYVRLETLTPSGDNGYRVSSEYDIWNNNYAFAVAALGSGRGLVRPDIAIVVAVGGGTLGYPQISVGFKDDFVLYPVTSSDATQITRFGDYFSARLIPGTDDQFATLGYDVILNPLPPGVPSGTCATVGCTANMRYVQFGRPPFVGPR
ncbi:hypothetical protein [Methylocaldum szegediense]|uniref:Uncharacterized protein n=1 Tax=Methylocaldum szegediense TaxID=73780 RepID=A0ABM9I6K6_9GAMM|nr:hypothetical protein [Methylocaldum szegediense]CAI8924498.1 protein of unknown function [Methylocaldum szegediense]